MESAQSTTTVLSMTTHDLERKGFVLIDGQWQKPPKKWKAKNEIDHQPSSAKPERSAANAPARKVSAQKANPTIRRVSIVSFRTRLIDPDNLCAKFHLDALRYCGVIADDSAKHITLEVRQEKSDNPRTEIEIT